MPISVAIVVRDRSSRAIRYHSSASSPVCEERLGASEQPGRPRCPGGGGSLREPFQCLFGEARLGAPGGRLDDIGQHEWGDADAVVVEDASCRA